MHNLHWFITTKIQENGIFMILCACKTTEAWMINRWNVWRYLVQHLDSWRANLSFFLRLWVIKCKMILFQECPENAWLWACCLYFRAQSDQSNQQSKDHLSRHASLFTGPMNVNYLMPESCWTFPHFWKMIRDCVRGRIKSPPVLPPHPAGAPEDVTAMIYISQPLVQSPQSPLTPIFYSLKPLAQCWGRDSSLITYLLWSAGAGRAAEITIANVLSWPNTCYCT